MVVQLWRAAHMEMFIHSAEYFYPTCLVMSVFSVLGGGEKKLNSICKPAHMQL